jgi:NTP pyrophosphatase (non-canonical NTP hydrolase)
MAYLILDETIALEEYQKFTESTDLTGNYDYYSLGLLSEIGEILGKLKRVIRKDYSLTDITHDLMLELGDVLWYYTRMCEHLGYSLENLNDICESFFFSLPEDDNIFSVLSDYVILLNRLGLDIVDATDDVEDLFMDFLDIFLIITEILDYDILDIVQVNYEKLSSRKTRGQLNGQGDRR